MLLRSSSTSSPISWLQQQNPKGLSSQEPHFIHQNLKSPIISLHSPKNITRVTSKSCLLPPVVVQADEIKCMDVNMMDGTGGEGGGGKICCGGGDNIGDYDYGSDGTNVYYQNMIDANPGNSLILGNYAKYLKEVIGDVLKAEEYCSRAILANPGDGSVLSMYAYLIWETQKDASRAQSYFDQAVKASPDDSYVMAAYAQFLWESD